MKIIKWSLHTHVFTSNLSELNFADRFYYDGKCEKMDFNRFADKGTKLVLN